MDNKVGGRCSVSLITQLGRCIFKKNKNIFRHLKLEIALAIPASNDEKYNSNNSAGQGLTIYIWANSYSFNRISEIHTLAHDGFIMAIVSCDFHLGIDHYKCHARECSEHILGL